MPSASFAVRILLAIALTRAFSASGCSSSGSTGAERLHVGVREHDRLDELRVDPRALLVVGRERQDLGEALDDARVQVVDLGLADDLLADQQVGEGLDRVGLLPQLHLLLRAVRGGVGRRVAGDAVRDRVQQDRALAGEQQLLLATHGVGHGQRVVPVHALGVHRLGVDAGADARQHVVAHGLAVGLAAHAVEVVEEVEQDRRVAAVGGAPQVPELVHGGEHHGFPDRPAAHGRVADVGDDDARAGG